MAAWFGEAAGSLKASIGSLIVGGNTEQNGSVSGLAFPQIKCQGSPTIPHERNRQLPAVRTCQKKPRVSQGLQVAVVFPKPS